MLKRQCKVGMRVIYKADYEEYGTVIKLKPYTAVLEKWDSEAGETYTTEIPYSRLWEVDDE
jgi:hypothetical protein